MSELLSDGDGRQLRLKTIIRRLHGGATVSEVKRDFSELIKGTSAEEIAAMEQALINEGFPATEIQRLCEVHVQVFESSLAKGRSGRTMPGHPAHSLVLENREAEKRVKSLLAVARGWKWAARMGGPGAGATGSGAPRADAARDAAMGLAAMAIHFARKENQLFPYLERHGFTGPSKVMWGKHDEIRAALKALLASVDEGPKAFHSSAKAVAAAMRRMFFMEERILIPTALRKLSKREWAEIRSGEDSIGFAWIKPGSEYDAGIVLAAEPAPGGGALAAFVAEALAKPDQPHPVPASAAYTGPSAEQGIRLNTGSVPAAILDAALRSLPLDLSITDANDRVLYYSDSPHRVFPRSPAVIGRAVQDCHPQKSVAMVERILEAFRKGERDLARFWIEMGGKLVVIEYRALRDADGAYLGTLETSQDASEIRALTGQRRLLEWE